MATTPTPPLTSTTMMTTVLGGNPANSNNNTNNTMNLAQQQQQQHQPLRLLPPPPPPGSGSLQHFRIRPPLAPLLVPLPGTNVLLFAPPPPPPPPPPTAASGAQFSQLQSQQTATAAATTSSSSSSSGTTTNTNTTTTVIATQPQQLQKRKLEQPQFSDSDNSPSSKFPKHHNDHSHSRGHLFAHSSSSTSTSSTSSCITSITSTTAIAIATLSTSQPTSPKGWSKLPDLVLNVLFQFFDHRDLVRVIGAVCQRWRSVSRKNLLWIDTRRFQGFKINNLAQAVDFSESLFRNGIYQGCAPFTKFSLPTGCSALLNSSFSRLYRVCPFIEELELPQATSAALLESAPNMAGAVATIRDRALKRIGKLTHLRKLDLHTHYGLTDEGIVRYLVQKPAALSLEAIILDLCVEISSDSIVALLNHCHKLRTLSSIGCNKCILSEQHLVSILKNLTSSASASASASASSISLQQSISNFSTTTTTTIITMPNDLFLPLEHLSVGLGTITDSTFDRFLSIVPRLKTLNLWSWTGATASMLSQLFRRLQHLESLTVHFTENTELTLPLIESASLRELFINTCVSCDRCLMKCPSLERLHIQSIRELSNLGLECPQLQALRIRSCKVFDTNLSSLISNMTRLQVLELVDCAGIHQLQMHSDSLESANLFMCGDLVELSIRGERMRSLTVESCMELLSAEVHCPNLESSHLFCIHQMMFPRLERLLLSSRRLSAFNLLRCINLVSLTLNCENLESLNLTDCRELRQLNLECPLLKKLMLHAPKIDLSSVETVDRLGLQCQNITMLSLASMPTLTDEALSRICTRWPTLQGLMLGGCNALVTPSISIPTLRGLHIGDCSSVSRISLSGCSTLNKLILKGCPNLVDETFEHLEHATPELKLLEVIQCRSLCRPFISNSSLNDAQFKLCASLLEPKLRCPNLRKIVFSVCDRLTGVRLTEAPHAQLLAIGARQLIVGEPHPQ